MRLVAVLANPFDSSLHVLLYYQLLELKGDEIYLTGSIMIEGLGTRMLGSKNLELSSSFRLELFNWMLP